MIDQSLTPVIVGVGQITDQSTPPEDARSPLALMVDAALQAGADAGPGRLLLNAVDSLVVIRLFSDTVPAFRSPFGTMSNPPWSVARQLGITPRELIYPPQGGDTPQTMLARACERIASGEAEVALIVGAEALRTELAARRAGLPLDWSDDAVEPPNELGGASRMYTAEEERHGMRSAIAMYALFEQALRGAKKQTVPERQRILGEIFAPFAEAAARNPLATRRGGYTPAEISSVSAKNPTIGFPYTKLMTANVYVDQAAALIVCSAAKADALGIPRDRRVYLHSSAHAHDQWFVTSRQELHRSHAIRRAVSDTLDASGITLDQVALFDVYSCFASAIEIACDEIGIATNDTRGLTVTGGLPFFGGPGNNYVTHAIAEMVQRLRGLPGRYGLITANGGLLTKHATGLYSTEPPTRPWLHLQPDSSAAQRAIDTNPTVHVEDKPTGAALVESYTVLNGKAGPERGIVVGRMRDNGARFIANTPTDLETLSKLELVDHLGRTGNVESTEMGNIFVPASDV